MKKIIGMSGMLFLCLFGCTNTEQDTSSESTDNTNKPHVTAASQIEAGRYLIKVGGCNDCHTHGFLQNNAIPESEWLTGSPMGWQGPWGTTYAKNLRISVHDYSEEDWVHMAKTRKALPPMAWFSLNNMSDEDLKAIYAYVKSIGLKGERMPAPLPPGKKPNTPFLSMMPQNMPQDSASFIQRNK